MITLRRSKRNFYVLLSAGVITIAAAAVITTALTREDRKENNYVDLNELPDMADQGDDKNYADDGDVQNIAGGNQDFAYHDNKEKVTEPKTGNSAEPATEKDLDQSAEGQTEKATDKSPENGQDSAEPENNGDQKKDAAEDADTELTAEASNNMDKPAMNPNVIAESMHFQEDKGLTWPVKGNVILNYSMDHVIYHRTLNSYRTNPAILIGAEAGTPVLASAEGVVLEIAEDPVTGITLTLGIGDEYSLVYGQLTDLLVKAGDVVEAGAELGKVAEPSKYYSLEGTNLYFQVMKGNDTVNPMLLLE